MNLKHVFFFVVFTIANIMSFGQKIFQINNSSKIYNAKIQIGKCDDQICIGTIELFTKNNLRLLQEFESENLNLRYYNNITDKTNTLIFDDFNFDGAEDIAIVNGNGGYNSFSYDVYLFNKATKHFVKSKKFTELASFQGMFTLDKKMKKIIAYSKSGCCFHVTTKYKVTPENGLVKIFNTVEDATRRDDYMYVTEEKLLNNKWTKKTKKHKIQDYYK